MSRKGRRSGSKKGNQSVRPASSNPSRDRRSSAAEPPVEPVAALHFELVEVPPSAAALEVDRAASEKSDAAPDSTPAVSFEAPFHASTPLDVPDASVPPVGDLPVGDLDRSFFFDDVPSESWLAELDIRDPRWVAKTTAEAARRRAHLTRYVVGAVGVAAVLCVAALVRVALPPADEGDLPRPLVQMVMPPGEVAPASPGLPSAGTMPVMEPAAPAKGGGADAGPG